MKRAIYWRALKKRELLSGAPNANSMPISRSPNFVGELYVIRRRTLNRLLIAFGRNEAINVNFLTFSIKLL